MTALDAILQTRIGGRFDLVEHLATTSHAWRFAADDADGSRCMVAVLRDDVAAETFVAEVAKLATLRHPHLVAPIEGGFDEATGRGYVVEPFHEAASLAPLLEAEAPIDPVAAARLALQLAEGLAEAHRRRLVHLAVAPEHVSLTFDRAGVTVARLGGFGEGLTRKTDASDAAADVRALGQLLDRMLSGVPLPPDLAAIRDAALAEQPYPDAGAFAAALGTVAGVEEPLVRTDLVRWDGSDAVSERALRRVQVGTMIDGRYRLMRLIAEGGMGAVYEARTPEDEAVAIKLIRPGTADDEGVRRFFREAKSVMNLDSPHVARVLGFGIDAAESVPFIVMELLRGSDLAQFIATHGPLDPPIAARIFVDACAGVAAAHAAGMVHRDIKPANLFLHEHDGFASVKVCDFGLVKPAPTTQSEALTRTGGLLGSPAYMAPEQAEESRAADSRSDVWSLAITLYEALTGVQAWGTYKNLGDLLLRIYTENVPSIQDRAPWIEPELADVVHRGLTRDPSERYEDAAALARALEPFASAAPLRREDLHPLSSERRAHVAPRATSLPTGMAQTLSPAHPTRKRLRAIGAAAALAVVIGGAITWRQAQNREAEEPATVSLTACVLAECIEKNEGRASRCRADGACVALETERCKVLADDRALASTHTVYIGAMFPRGDPGKDVAELGRASINAMDLARRDFMTVTGGLPSKDAGAPARPLGIIACDDTGEYVSVGRHLALNAGVPAVIGFRGSRELIELATDVFIPNDVLAVSALNQSAIITDLPHPPGRPRLVWRTAVATNTRSDVIAAFVRDSVEPSMAKRKHPNSMLKVLLLRPHNSAGVAFAEALYDKLRFNGRSIRENRENFREVSFDFDEENAQLPSDTIETALEFRPDIIIAMTIEIALEQLAVPLEARWPPEAPRPWYIAARNLEGTEISKALLEHPELAERVFGMDTPSLTPVNEKFTNSYNAAFREQYSPAVSPSAPYDSFYLVAYAAYVAGPGKTSGSDLARAIAKLIPPGKAIDVGPVRLLEAFGELQRGRNIDLRGAYSRMDFDLKTGESTVDYVILCPHRAAKAGTVDSIESGLSYDPVGRRMRGTLLCPPFR